MSLSATSTHNTGLLSYSKMYFRLDQCFYRCDPLQGPPVSLAALCVSCVCISPVKDQGTTSWWQQQLLQDQNVRASSQVLVTLYESKQIHSPHFKETEPLSVTLQLIYFKKNFASLILRCLLYFLLSSLGVVIGIEKQEAKTRLSLLWWSGWC